jgi:hypothetical protein
MRLPLFLVALLVSLGPMRTQTVAAQSYRLISWEGKPVTVSVSDRKPFIHRIAISCAADTVLLIDHQYTESVRVLQYRFLQVTYGTRCGSGCMIRNTVLISISKNKPVVSLLVMSANEWEDDTRSRRYRVTLAMPTRSTLQARVHDEYMFPDEPTEAHAFERLIILRLDTTQQVFYSAFEPTARVLPVFGSGKSPFEPGDLSALHLVEPYVYIPYFPVMPQYVAGIFPVVRLSGQLYYFIKGEWYAGAEKTEADGLNWFIKDAFRYAPSRGHNLLP